MWHFKENRYQLKLEKIILLNEIEPLLGRGGGGAGKENEKDSWSLYEVKIWLQLGRSDQVVMPNLKKVKPLKRHLNLVMPLQ